MATTLLEKLKHLTDQALELSTVSALSTESRRNRLVAHWLVDKNSKLFCQWVIED